jgi:hypothetical protein
MKFLKMIGWSSALCLSAMSIQAQETNEVGQLKKQLQQMQESFEKVTRAQQQQIEALTKKLDEFTKTAAPTNVVAVPPEKTDEQKKLEADLAAELAKDSRTNAVSSAKGAASTSPFSVPWTASQPITIARAGSAYMNISFDALIDAGWSTAADPSAQLQLGDHDPQKRGFSLRNAEIALDGAVDPYFKGFANIVLKLDNNNETDIELEETYVQSTSLPGNLQLKAGQFFAAFGRNNPQHPHQWAFVDAPIISTRAFGPDGLRNIGAQVSWLAPTPFYTELFLGVFDGQGGTAHSFRNVGESDDSGTNRFAGRATFDRNLRGPQDMLFTPRVVSSFEISDTQTLTGGFSGAFGANDTGPHSRTEIYGADVYWKWKPSNAMEGFPFVSWQTEAMYRRFGAGADDFAPTPLRSQNLRDWGAYSQVLWGFKPRWVTGIRGDYASGNSDAFDSQDSFRGERYRVSPVLTFFPSEFSKIRLQYNYDHGEYFGVEHSVWLQMEFLLGSHGAHKY